MTPEQHAERICRLLEELTTAVIALIRATEANTRELSELRKKND
jgi:hypothetical protein